MSELKLKPVTAYTVYSSDNDRQSSEKGIYKDSSIAAIKAVGSGWYGSDGEVRDKKNVYEDENGKLYIVNYFGEFNDVAEQYRIDTIASIKTKLTQAELNLLGID